MKYKIQKTYIKTFQKAKLNKKLIRRFINNKREDWNLPKEYNHKNYICLNISKKTNPDIVASAFNLPF